MTMLTNNIKWFGLFLSIAPAISFADIVQVGPAARPEIMTNNQVRAIMVKEALARYGYCACPYSRDSLGGQCGTESQYYKPGAFKVHCYPIDITSEQVYFFRLKRITAVKFGTSYSDFDRGEYEGGPTSSNPAESYFTNNSENTRRQNALQSGVPGGMPPMPGEQAAEPVTPTSDYFKNTGQNTAVRIQNNFSSSGGYGGNGGYGGYSNPYASGAVPY